MSSRKRKRSSHLYSIDVLTDGSEGTGSACLFLSLWGRRRVCGDSNCKVDEEEDAWWQGSPKVRYALNLGGDTCSRIATDQRYKLAATKAVFCPNHASLWGWKAVQLALERAGAAGVSLVSSHPFVEDIVNDGGGGRRNNACPLVRLCDLNALPPCGDGDGASKWWQVYEEDGVLVHAKAVNANATWWAFLYTIYSPATCSSRQKDDIMAANESSVSFLVLPPGSSLDMVQGSTTAIHLVNLPLAVNGKPIECDFVVALNPEDGDSGACDELTDDNTPLFLVSAAHNNGGHSCPRLLVRARQQSEGWHKECPEHFPWNGSGHAGPSSFETTAQNTEQAPTNRLLTGTSLCWWGKDEHEPVVHNATKDKKLVFFLLERVLNVKKSHPESAQKPQDVDDEDLETCSLRNRWPRRLVSFLKPPRSSDGVASDENEIDLEDDSDTDGPFAMEKPKQCHLELFSLGTGCAAPSAHRGASAYFVRGIHTVTGSEWNILLEAGEGVVTQLQRHVSANAGLLSQISLIWISHSHWDHYGGLVPLLDAISRERGKSEKAGRLPVPLVMAPRTILRFCRNMLCQQGSSGDWFRGVAHEDDGPSLTKVLDDWNSRYSAIAFWENVLVEHSCRHSYGCVFGLRGLPGKPVFTFAFSGDTRPCERFVSVCRRRAIDASVDFLLHEATFCEDEKEMSIKKKHSTVSEAIEVGREVRASKVLLSHFSQRYDSLPEVPVDLQGQVGIALDGLRIILG